MKDHPSPHPLKVALADDEPLARARLSRLLTEAGCEVLAELEDGAALLRWLKSAPALDALFLDIQMPGPTGLEVAAELPKTLPVVFVTAHAEHALRAFDAAALDYLLKPIRAERLAQTLERLREGHAPARPGHEPAPHPHGHHWPQANRAESPQAIAGAEPRGPQVRARVPIRAGEGHVFLDLKRLTHFEVEEEVVWACQGPQRHRTPWTTLAEAEQAFPHAGLLRIQRHLLLRPEAILGLRPLEGGRVAVRIAEGQELEVSRTATPKVRGVMGV